MSNIQLYNRSWVKIVLAFLFWFVSFLVFADSSCGHLFSPQNVFLTKNASVPSLTIYSDLTGTISYQWYKSTDGTTNNGELIPGANSATYALPSTLSSSVGVSYYYVLVSNGTCSLTSKVVSVFVSDQTTTLTVNSSGCETLELTSSLNSTEKYNLKFSELVTINGLSIPSAVALKADTLDPQNWWLSGSNIADNYMCRGCAIGTLPVNDYGDASGFFLFNRYSNAYSRNNVKIIDNSINNSGELYMDFSAIDSIQVTYVGALNIYVSTGGEKFSLLTSQGSDNIRVSSTTNWIPINSINPVRIEIIDATVSWLFIKSIKYKLHKTKTIDILGGNSIIAYDPSDNTSLRPNTKYTVSARSVSSDGLISNWSSAKTFITKPAKVTNLNTSGIGVDCFAANWTIPSDLGTEQMTYTLEIYKGGVLVKSIDNIASSVSSYNVIGLDENTTYTYKVKSICFTTGCVVESSEKTVKTLSSVRTITLKIVDLNGNPVSSTNAWITFKGHVYNNDNASNIVKLGVSESLNLCPIVNLPYKFLRWRLNSMNVFDSIYTRYPSVDITLTAIFDYTDNTDITAPVANFSNTAEGQSGFVCGDLDVEPTAQFRFSFGNEKIYAVDPLGNLSCITSDTYLYQHLHIYKLNKTTDLYEDISSSGITIVHGPLKDGNKDANGCADLVYVEIKSNNYNGFDRDTQYKLMVDSACFADAAGNVARQSSCQFRIKPVEQRKLFVSNHKVKTYTIGDTQSLGTLWNETSTSTLTHTFCVLNSGNANLTIKSIVVSGNNFSIKSISSGSLGVGPSYSLPYSSDDTLFVTVQFSGNNIAAGAYSGLLKIVSDDNMSISSEFTINLTATKGDFILPYTYESGCTSPIMTSEKIVHDYSSVSDIPSYFTIAGMPFEENSSYYYPSYMAYQSEGSCVLNGNSAIRVGRKYDASDVTADAGVFGTNTFDNRLKITLPYAAGNVSLKWSANGYRTLKIYDENGKIYLSTDYLEGRICHTHTAIINNCSDGSSSTILYIEFIGSDPTALTTISELSITKCNTEVKSSACDITEFEVEGGSNVRIYDKYIFLQKDDCNASSLTASKIEVSPGASVIPSATASAVSVTSSVSGLTTNHYEYTVTSANGNSSKTYQVYVECPMNASSCYADSITKAVSMNQTNQKLTVLEISNGDCVVPVTGAGSKYTIHFLTKESVPVDGYKISGPSTVCIGSKATYVLANAPESNNPLYTWSIESKNASGFKIVNGTETVGADGITRITYSGKELTLQAPNYIDEANVNLTITIELDYADAKCEQLRGTAQLSVKATKLPPSKIGALQASCVGSDGRLLITVIPTPNADGSIVDASSYGWSFTPSYLNDRIEQYSSSTNQIMLNLGNESPDISAVVSVQNGCGVGEDSGKLPVNYASYQTEWTGTADNNWNNNNNWTNRVPAACTNVIIRDVDGGLDANNNAKYYPEIKSGESGECNYITFKPGAGVLGLSNLTYNKAFIKANFQRNKWYTITTPLKNMYSGDYYFNGSPISYAKVFDEVNPDAWVNTKIVGNWSKSFSNPTYKISPLHGFAFEVSSKAWNYPYGAVYSNDAKEVSFPRMNTDSSIISVVYPYLGNTGSLYMKLPYVMGKNDSVYRFACENGMGKLVSPISIPIKGGLNLIGNPLMSHLDLYKFYYTNNNRFMLMPIIKLWNGSEFITYNVSTKVWSSPAYKGTLIAPMQSFIVEGYHAGNLDFDLNYDFSKDVEGTNNLRSAVVSDNLMYISADNGGDISSMAIYRIINDTVSNGFDSFDSYKLFSTYTSGCEIYGLADGVSLDMNAFKTIPYTMPLGLRSDSVGKVRLSFKNVDSFADLDVYLINSKIGEEVNLKEIDNYNYNMESTEDEGNLYVEFINPKAVVTKCYETSNDAEIQIFTRLNNVIRVLSNSQEPIRSIAIIDESGRIVYKKDNINLSLFDIVMNDIPHSYIVRATTDNSVINEKVFIR